VNWTVHKKSTVRSEGFRNFFSDSILFLIANDDLLGGSIATTIQHTNAHITYTKIHVSHKITPLNMNKT
jgi:hypothetical protein